MDAWLGQAGAAVGGAADGGAAVTMTSLLALYAPVFIAALAASLIATPLVRRLAFRLGAIDKPDFVRKAHTRPVAYMGGVAVLAGLVAGIGLSYLLMSRAPMEFRGVPMAVVIGMVAIALTGLADDLWGWDPRLKIAGQLVAAAALAIEQVGVKVAAGIIVPLAQFVDPSLNSADLVFPIPMPWGPVSFDVIYWVGTAIIAIFVLGGCNAANLIDGLDGLLSGVTGIVAAGLLAISLLMATSGKIVPPDAAGVESLAGARIVLSLAALGAVLGFLPYNFNPARIFLGDCGSLLLGYCSVVVILMLGDEGMTHLVVCGLIVFSIPIIDTLFAIVRRKRAGVSLSGADSEHIHHKLLRRTGTVRKAVLRLYALGAAFALFGAGLAAMVLETDYRARHVYLIAGLYGIGVVLVAIRMSKSTGPAPVSKPAP